MEFFREMGVTAYPLAALALATLLQGIHGFRGLSRSAPPGGSSFRIHAVLAWGGLAALVGLIGSLVGVGMMARWAEGVAEVPSSLLWGGLRVALSTTLFGLLTFFFAALAWMGLLALEGRSLPTDVQG